MSVNLAFSLKVNNANIYINFDITKFFCHYLKQFQGLTVFQLNLLKTQYCSL